jgi:lipopolysaccharide/colanic/teichoic acid biosynthesis glycosyltransferase
MNSHSIYSALKRSIDMLVSIFGLCLSAPIIGLAGLAIMLDSPGPILFRSRRVGKEGREFNLLKLRTMTVVHDKGNLLVTSATDTRILRVGKFLRKTKIDELPQFWNVLRGDMSLIGPRPEAPKYAARYPKEFEEILKVRPGLSDRATLQFVDEESILASESNPEEFYIKMLLPKKIVLYLEYVRNPSLVEDCKILVETAVIVVQRFFSAMLGRRD